MTITVTANRQNRWAGTFGTVANLTASVTTASSVTLPTLTDKPYDAYNISGASTVSTIINEWVLPGTSTSQAPLEGQEIWLQMQGPTGTPSRQRIKNNNPAAGTVEYYVLQSVNATVGLKAVGGKYVPIAVQGGASQSTAT